MYELRKLRVSSGLGLNENGHIDFALVFGGPDLVAVGLQEVLDVRVQHRVALRVQAFACHDLKLEPE
jgi:hypothetical protein